MVSCPCTCLWIDAEQFRKKMIIMNKDLGEYRKELQKGHIQKTYRKIMEGMLELQRRLGKKYPDRMGGSFYPGYMDMSYFPLTPSDMAQKGLKVAVVFIHETGQLEIWLAARNKKIQHEYIRRFESKESVPYTISKAEKGVDSIIEHSILGDPDFNRMDELADIVDSAVTVFLENLEEII